MIQTSKNYDVAVIGAGVFGAWIAYHLQRSGKTIVLLDAYGAANSRASSGGESRVMRMGYGADEYIHAGLCAHLSSGRNSSATLKSRSFIALACCGWRGRMTLIRLAVHGRCKNWGVRFEKLSRAELEQRYPQIAFGSVTWGILEPDSGALMARRAVQRVVQETLKSGADYVPEAVETPTGPTGNARLASLATRSGLGVRAANFIFACGPWLPTLFPDLLTDRIHPTRQEVFFFGVDPGDRRFASPLMPAWVDFGDEIYGIPDLENRGFKIAFDRHGPLFDPDRGDRVVTTEGLSAVRQFLAQRFPGLQDAPLLETRVCQYENTSNGDFLIDRHPAFDNVWLVGGGLGDGFKHGPALGEYVAARVVEGGTVEPRFTLATKGKVQKRTVF